MNKIVLFFSFFLVFYVNAQIDNRMKFETIYKQQHGNLHLTFDRNNSVDKVEWKTLVTNKKGDTIVLHTDSSEKNIAWKHQETIGESPTSLYNISGSYLDENNLYIIYNRFGELFISKYTFTEKNSFVKEEKIIDSYLTSGGFGRMLNKTDFKKIENKLYFNLFAGQQSSQYKQNLYKMDLNSFLLTRIIFETPKKIFKAVAISEFGIKRYDQLKINIETYSKMSPSEKEKNLFQKPSESQVKSFNLFSKYIDKPFYYYEMSVDKTKKEEVETFLSDNDLEWYPMFSLKRANVENNSGVSGTYEFLPLDENKIKRSEEYLSKLLTEIENSKYKKKVQILGNIYQSNRDYTIFFFYKETALVTKIIRFQNFENEWIIGDYKEEEIKQK